MLFTMILQQEQIECKCKFMHILNEYNAKICIKGDDSCIIFKIDVLLCGLMPGAGMCDGKSIRLTSLSCMYNLKLNL